MSFKDRDFEHRFKMMGDIAEQAFEMVWHTNFERFGLNRPRLKMSALPSNLRHTPDYLTSNNLIEVQGLGKDQTLKLKLEKYQALEWWHKVHPLLFFVYDSFNDRVHSLEWGALKKLCKKAPIEKFPEGKEYYAIHAELIWRDGET
tara:strand:- start:325 stop:762 length:438 start_codon:yes stop_codon:yes gene_type:complete